MNCPSRPDRIEGHPDWNQNPSLTSSGLTTRADLNGIVNLRARREADSDLDTNHKNPALTTDKDIVKDTAHVRCEKEIEHTVFPTGTARTTTPYDRNNNTSGLSHSRPQSLNNCKPSVLSKISTVIVQYGKFIGPGFLIAVAYIDPGNYATDVGAGAQTQYAHLFIVLMSNLFAIFLQSLCIKLGSVTGLNLAENCRKHLPKWLTIVLYVLSESAIIATDIAEVIGTAIALNLLLKIPLVAGCAISLIDVVILLIFYKPDGSMTKLRFFECFVMCLVLGVLVCFCIQLSYVRDASIGHVFRGYVPSAAVVQGNGIYLSCGILGATVMPHSIFLGSGVVQPRLKELDIQLGNPVPLKNNTTDADEYRPSLQAIETGLKYSIIELATSLFTFALFINSAILIVAGSSLYPDGADADLFGIFHLLTSTLGKAAGILFALALLLSGTSAGIVCTMAGQMVSEGMINWTLQPWLRRLITRLISILPSIIIAGAIGKQGLNTALTASQVVLSVILPFVTAPLLWFTCKSSIMTVQTDVNGRRSGTVDSGVKVNMRNGWVVTVFAVLIWLVLVVMNVALLVLVGMGKI